MDIYSKCFDNQNALIGRKAGAYCAENRAVGVSPVCTVCNSSSLSRSGEISSRFRVPPVTEGTHYLMWLRHTSVSCMRMRVVTRVILVSPVFRGKAIFLFPRTNDFNKKRKELLVWKTAKSIRWVIFSRPKGVWNGQRRTALKVRLYGAR